jgi:hypothetical protein
VWPGLDGLLLLLSALARQPLHCAWAHMLPVVCGAQAAFVACPTTHTADTLAMMVVAQLMPDAAAAADADANAAAAAKDAAQEQQQQQQQQGQAAGSPSVAGDAAGAQKQQSGGQQQQQQLRCVVQVVVRASSHEVLLAIQQEPDAWLADISQVRLRPVLLLHLSFIVLLYSIHRLQELLQAVCWSRSVKEPDTWVSDIRQVHLR